MGLKTKRTYKRVYFEIIYRFLHRPSRVLSFASFGKRSNLFRPDRIINPKKIFIAENVIILKHARMEVYGNNSFIKIGNNTSIGQNLHIVSCGDLTIGNNVIISGNVFVSNCDHKYEAIDVPIYNQGMKYEKTIIGDECFLGYGAVIQAGVTLGNHCIVGSNAVVRKGIYPSNSVIVGVPAKVVKKYDESKKKWVKAD